MMILCYRRDTLSCRTLSQIVPAKEERGTGVMGACASCDSDGDGDGDIAKS